MNAQYEMLLVQGEIANLAQREFTPPIEEDVHRVNVSRNVKRRLLTSHSNMPTSASMFTGIAKQQVGPAYTVENRGNEDRNYVPISRVFDRFRSMRTTNIGADCMAQTVEQHFGFAYTVENRGDEDRYCVPI
ncbi:hypothetical protein Tco_0008754, partial [Tanacetum coccineum]